MTRILILYGTTDGHTATIAHRLASMLETRGAEADPINVAHARPLPSWYNAVIVAASVHTGAYQPEVRQWTREHSPALADMPTAFISVCLGVLQPDPAVQKEVHATIDRFLASTGWRPTAIKSVAGAVLYTQYGWLKRRMMRRIVAKAGGDTDTSRDYEYTDWADLDRFADQFARLVVRAGRPRQLTAEAAAVGVGGSSTWT
jgi:menaquinone-dependent protoporphyrinogen oxidase